MKTIMYTEKIIKFEIIVKIWQANSPCFSHHVVYTGFTIVLFGSFYKVLQKCNG